MARMVDRTTPTRPRSIQMTSGTKIDVQLDQKRPYELDGGARPATRRLKIRVEHAALPVCTPPDHDHDGN